MADLTPQGDVDDTITRWIASGYETAESADLNFHKLDSTTDIWTTGAINVWAILESGTATPTFSNMEVVPSSYNPYIHAEYYSGGDLIMDFPTWEVFCSGYLPTGTFNAITTLDTGSKSIAEIRDEVFRIVGSQYMIDRERSRGSSWQITRTSAF